MFYSPTCRAWRFFRVRCCRPDVLRSGAPFYPGLVSQARVQTNDPPGAGAAVIGGFQEGIWAWMAIVLLPAAAVSAYAAWLARRLGRERHKRKQAEAALTRQQEQLEERVRDRTAAMEYQALHDPLTDLPNRSLFFDRLQQAIITAHRDNEPFVVLMMDLDRFKEVNDALGHHVGDLLLRMVGARLQNMLRGSDTVGRLGGDEFAVLLPTADVEDGKALARNILHGLERMFEIDAHIMHVGASIGIAAYPHHGKDANTLLQRADVAMYLAKRANNAFEVYDVDRDEHTPERLALRGELHHAIHHDELVLYYHPKINLKTRTVVGVEALVRWNHPQHGLLPPDVFIPLAEQTGLIRPLTLWVCDRALSQCSEWRRRKGMEISVAVNLSARNLLDRHLPNQLAQLLEAWDVPPGLLVLEITESAIMSDPDRALGILRELAGMGVRLSIDDFGTGYSTLTQLKQLPVDELKIDKSFVINMLTDENDAVIVRSTIDLAHNLGLNVTAEGVETNAILEELGGLRCDAAQGFYMTRPVPADDFVHWVRKSGWGMRED